MRGGDDELGLGRAIQVRAPEKIGRLEGAVLVENHARRDEHRPGQMVAQSIGVLFLLGEGEDRIASPPDHEPACDDHDADNQKKTNAGAHALTPVKVSIPECPAKHVPKERVLLRGGDEHAVKKNPQGNRIPSP